MVSARGAYAPSLVAIRAFADGILKFYRKCMKLKKVAGEGAIQSDQGPLFNPKGIASISPGLARVREGLPWVAANKIHNPARVESQPLMKPVQPMQGCAISLLSPRVARSSQPWAESFNPYGISHTNDRRPIITSYSTENSDEPLINA
jgi:hypothetical protein